MGRKVTKVMNVLMLRLAGLDVSSAEEKDIEQKIVLEHLQREEKMQLHLSQQEDSQRQ